MALVHPPAYAQLRQVTPPNAAVVLAENPSVMSLEGTNTWILRAPGSDECVVVDPGAARRSPSRPHRPGPGRADLISHRHYDHTEGAGRFAELTGNPVCAVDPEHRHGGGRGLEDGEVVEAAGLRIRVLATPRPYRRLAVLRARGRQQRPHRRHHPRSRHHGSRRHRRRSRRLPRFAAPPDRSGGGRLHDAARPRARSPGSRAHRPRLSRAPEERLEQVRSALRVLGDDAPRAASSNTSTPTWTVRCGGCRREVRQRAAGVSAQFRVSGSGTCSSGNDEGRAVDDDPAFRGRF